MRSLPWREGADGSDEDRLLVVPRHTEDVAKLTAGKYKKYYNPHDSLHYATYSDCVACHREHQPSRLDCNNSNCHREFKYKVP